VPSAAQADRAGLLDSLRQQLAGLEILDVERVLTEARIVRGVSEEAAVVVGHVGAQRHEWLTGCERVDVKRDLFGPVHVAATAEDRVLLALLGARVPVVPALPVRHRAVGLLDAAEHLVVQLALQRLRGREHHFGVGVLGVEVCGDVRVRLVAEPRVVVREALAVNLGDVRDALRDRRLGKARCVGRHLLFHRRQYRRSLADEATGGGQCRKRAGSAAVSVFGSAAPVRTAGQ
jgi:hypothetical protein